MNTTTFTFKKPKDTWFYLAGGTFFCFIALNVVIQIISYQGFSFNGLISLVAPLAIGAPGILLFNVCLLRSQYQQIDAGKTLELDEETGELIVICNNKSCKLYNADIKKVELYKSWSVFSVLHMPAYMKINLQDGRCLIITSFLATEDDLENFIQDAEAVTDVNMLFRVKAGDIRNCIYENIK